MQARNRTPMYASGVLAISALALPALAGSPAALDRVPADAPVVIGIPHLNGLMSDLDQLNAMLGEDASPELMLGMMMLRGMEGLDLDGSAAFVVYPDSNEEDEIDDERMVAIVPVSDFAALSQGREAVNGFVPYPLPENQEGYLHDIGGGFALFSDSTETLSGFNAAKGQMGANNATIGKAGQSIASDSDIFMYVNLAQMGDQIAMAKEGMEEQSEMVGMMGGEQAQAGVDMMINAFESIVNDGQAFITGMNFDATKGISFDAGVQFKDGTSTASYLNNAGANASKYLNNIPDDEYFVAAAFDFSGEGMKQLMSDYLEIAEQMDTAGMTKLMNIEQMIAHAQGGAQIMGAVNPMGMTGVFSSVTTYTECTDSKAMLSSMGEIYNALNGQGAEGVSFTSSYDQDGTKIGDSTAHAFNMKINVPQGMGGGAGFGAPSPAMIMQLMFGPNMGPAGYIGESGSGVVQTLSMDQENYTRAVQAAQGKNTLGAVQAVKSSASHLQDNTVLEMYFGADHTLNSVGPMLMMFGLVPEFEQLGSHAPVAMGITADGGGATARFWIPMEVIGTVMEMIPADAIPAMGGHHDDDDQGMDF